MKASSKTANRLPATVRLPKRAKVYVVTPDVEAQPVAYIGSPRLVQPGQAVDFLQKKCLRNHQTPNYDDLFFTPPAPLRC